MNKPTVVVEQFLSDLLNDLYPSLQNTESYLYGIEDNDEYVSGAADFLSKDKDIYSLIEQDSTKAYTQIYDILCFFTFGWAAPFTKEDDSPPSQHPDRIRILLSIFTYADGTIVSAMKRCDDSTQELAFQHGEQSGPLHDVLKSVYS